MISHVRVVRGYGKDTVPKTVEPRVALRRGSAMSRVEAQLDMGQSKGTQLEYLVKHKDFNEVVSITGTSCLALRQRLYGNRDKCTITSKPSAAISSVFFSSFVSLYFAPSLKFLIHAIPLQTGYEANNTMFGAGKVVHPKKGLSRC